MNELNQEHCMQLIAYMDLLDTVIWPLSAIIIAFVVAAALKKPR